MHDRELSRALLELGRPRVAVLGDFMLDRYLWGDATRVSPEAPVPVVLSQREEDRLGGAGNVAANLCDLGAYGMAFGVLGRDQAGEDLQRLLIQAGVESRGLLAVDSRPTSRKVRVMARSQQMLRVDQEASLPLTEEDSQRLLAQLSDSSWDVLVISDYGKGVLSPQVLEGAIAEARKRGAPSLVDPKHRDFRRYRGATLITPNRAEAEAAAGQSMDSFAAVAEIGERLRHEAELDALLITLGAEGMCLIRPGQPMLEVPTAARSVFDVTGAGDTVIATMALALGGGADWPVAVGLANAAAGLAVARVGTATVGRSELLHHLASATPDHKVVDDSAGPALEHALAALRREGLRLVFTNGCFDILHAGHVRYLQEARSLGDALLVGINDDASVRRLKGEERPFNSLADRMDVLAALECVDLVVAFPEDTPENLIHRVRPDVLVKGADWRDKGVVGADFVKAQGGEVRLVEIYPGRSTTGLAQRIRDRG
ncbi:MAG: bifunctional D-glycero-beta-D-manno-heptose-7-phosphate kinase/D-glycero-beta-D-manno-heptose 1-phosphate adenylyltransferase HldE [Planctomycetota bacterium]|nr:MAG: bifunctional D-glycero-beta-D-manno-heptose-7-phosphate kinase/D-glycero-beta-D-manno-heptose 1-phosphate adenylyltransferase HldE [Planctomycetota bacterium]